MTNKNIPQKNIFSLQKWGAAASFMMALAMPAALWVYLTGNLQQPFGPLLYALADLLYGPVWGACLIIAVLALRDRLRESAPRRMDVALLAAFAAACAFVAVAAMRSANRYYHLAHPELHLEASATVLTVWAVNIAAGIGAACHFLGWAFLLTGWAGWNSERLPRMLSALFLLAGLAGLSVIVLPDMEGAALALTIIASIWQGIYLLNSSQQTAA
jgi:hypothetical protein